VIQRKGQSLGNLIYLLVAVIIVIVLIIVILRLVGAGTALGADIPTTAPVVQVPVVPVPVDIDSKWTPTAVITVATIIIGLLAGTLIPAIIALMKATKAETKSESNESNLKNTREDVEHIKRTNERQQTVLDSVQQQMPPKSP
jgi:hypothetical protein